MSSLDLTVVILTLDEEQHIARCIDSIGGIAQRIVVLDSGSTDKTQQIASNLGAEVYVHTFINQALQLNWALDHAAIRTTWVMRIDADEIATPELTAELVRLLPTIPSPITGLTVNRRVHFMGSWIRHGGLYPNRILRIWRNGAGRSEERWMDEHIVVKGKVASLHGDIADINLSHITWWIAKHNNYATREAIALMLAEVEATARPDLAYSLSLSSHIKRILKEKIYSRLPLGLRPAVYFLYRYFLRLGFLDGWAGFTLHFLQGFWYRFLVDVKIYELRQLIAHRGETLQDVVRAEYGFNLRSREDK